MSRFPGSNGPSSNGPRPMIDPRAASRSRAPNLPSISDSAAESPFGLPRRPSHTPPNNFAGVGAGRSAPPAAGNGLFGGYSLGGTAPAPAQTSYVPPSQFAPPTDYVPPDAVAPLRPRAGPAMPARPARSERRPSLASIPQSAALSFGDPFDNRSTPPPQQQIPPISQRVSPQPQPPSINTRERDVGPTSIIEEEDSPPPRSRPQFEMPSSSRLHQAIQREQNGSRDLRPTSGASYDSRPSDEFEASDFPPKKQEEPTSPETPAVKSAIAAFASAGQRAKESRQMAPSRSKQSSTRGSVDKRPSVDQTPSTAAFQNMQAVLTRIEEKWPMIRQPQEDETEPRDDFDAVTLALALLDTSSVGLSPKLPEFIALQDALANALASSISSNYKAFDSSVSAYNGILSSLNTAQNVTNGLRTGLTEIRETLSRGRQQLIALDTRRKELEEMEKVLDIIDQLKSVPDRLETLMSEKRFLTAAILLTRALRTINKPEMVEIGALSDLRSYFHTQENSMLDILIEELHNHLYLKSYYCDLRWKPYSKGQTTLQIGRQVDRASRDILATQTDAEYEEYSNPHYPDMLNKYLNQLTVKESIDPLVDRRFEDAMLSTTTEPKKVDLTKDSASPESDSFAYIESLLEALGCLDKLTQGLDTVLQRVPLEIYNVVDKTVGEVEERNDEYSRWLMAARPATSAALIKQESRDSNHSHHLGDTSAKAQLLSLKPSDRAAAEANDETLLDLFWTLYSKFDAVLQGFRCVYEIAGRIQERKGPINSTPVQSQLINLLFSIIEIWKTVQSEVRLLLHDYLADDKGDSVGKRNTVISINDVLRAGSLVRDTSKPVFTFGGSDPRTIGMMLRFYEEELQKSLRISVPGLVSSSDSSGNNPVVISASLDDTSHLRGTAASNRTHRMLVMPNEASAGILYKPTMAFISRVRLVLPTGVMTDEDKGFEGLLDDFLQPLFKPFLEVLPIQPVAPPPIRKVMRRSSSFRMSIAEGMD